MGKMMAFFEGLMRQVMERQEVMQRCFQEAIEKRQDRMASRRRVTVRHEMSRLSPGEHELSCQRARTALPRRHHLLPPESHPANHTATSGHAPNPNLLVPNYSITIATVVANSPPPPTATATNSTGTVADVVAAPTNPVTTASPTPTTVASISFVKFYQSHLIHSIDRLQTSPDSIFGEVNGNRGRSLGGSVSLGAAFLDDRCK
ncbi:uncharacterized protein A4U43_C05F29080 [Asparagus officinalis]|uniref:Uncharacterized protein n=1 Tax=Asparagus officinalis TaxID=4686 RepID=A0A5P1EVQ9_ASPOF|nr:uncharacterized protein A4U43_C05F29080 [Asparagus officinalis]